VKNKKKAIIIGFGSIGKRHYKILKKLNYFDEIFVFSNQKVLIKNKITKLEALKKINPDYFVICSDTSKHYFQLKYIINNFSKKKILVEKPLYEKVYDLKIKNDNKVYVAYNFRFHPIIKKIKSLCSNKNIFFIKVFCGSYLPSWRPNRDYKKIYSSDIKRGGGVLLDLSHEIDYINWIFGKINTYHKIYKKISYLKTTSKDYLNISGYIKRNTYLELGLNYFSKFPKRDILIEGKNISIFADLIKNKLQIINKDKFNIYNFPKNSLDRSYELEHRDILFKGEKKVCSYIEALEILKFSKNISKS
jgi:predicted dehydrogenase